jgi:N4-(beta-N-acetylglucosaminyl)-L-asparaginase
LNIGSLLTAFEARLVLKPPREVNSPAVPTTFVSTWQDAGEPCVRKAWETYQGNSDLLDACEAGLIEVELDPRFKAVGFGGLPNADGDQELDAGLMDGRTLDAGAVCAVRGIVPVISLARKVMEETPHVMLAGDQAVRFAEAHGFERRCLQSQTSLQEYEKWRANRTDADVAHLVHDTVTIVGRDDSGHCAAACSTSGLAWKLPGRVGDSPIVGAGYYADDEAGAAGATGVGEDIWRFLLSYHAVEAMRLGSTAQEACERAVRRMVTRRPQTREKCSVVFAVSKHGDWGAAASTSGFTAWTCIDGQVQSHVIPGLS